MGLANNRSTLPERLKREKAAVENFFDALRADAAGARPQASGLVETGLRLLEKWP